MKIKDFTFIFALIALALFDALFGGALAALLQHEGWTPKDQRVNDIWQIGFGTICVLVVIVIFAFLGIKITILQKTVKVPGDENFRYLLQKVILASYNARWQAIYLLATLLTYAEDLLFYPALYAFNYTGVTSLISGGYEYNFPRFLWPWSLSGWFGFLTRWIWGETIKLPTVAAMLLAFGTLAGIVWHMQMRKDKTQ